MEAVCQKCRKRKNCAVPCRPVELHLQKDNLTVYEKNQPDNTIMVYPRSREAHRSTLSMGDDKAGDPRFSSKEAQAFSTEAENPFTHYDPNFRQTSVFLKRYFARWSYADIAQFHDISTDAARKLYHAASKKLLYVIMEMDALDKMTEEERKKANVAKQNRYVERNREAIKAKRRERYARNKERINAKRRERYAAKKK